MEDLNFIPINREVKLDMDKVMMCKYHPDGTIDYINDFFSEISGYEVHEVVGNNIQDYLHKDTPKTILNLLEETAKNKENIHLILKDHVKDGRYYWFLSDFEYQTEKDGRLVSITTKRIAAPRIAIPEIDNLYKKILKIEEHTGLDIAKTFFEGFLEEKGMSLEEYTESLVVNSNDLPQVPHPKSSIKKSKKKKSLFAMLFKK